MIIVTGGAGFIGSNIVRGLNESGHEEILVVDDLFDGTKFRNLAQARICDYRDAEQFRDFIEKDQSFTAQVTAIYHQGACTDTTEWNGRYMMQNNYEYSKLLLHYCLRRQIPFIYASSASIYGIGRKFEENPENEAPVNVYAYSKYLFDVYVRRIMNEEKSQIAGLRYFNVFGPGEQHKKSMASVIYHFNEQILSSGAIRLFKGSDGFSDGEQRRDFIHVDDVVAVNLWLMQNPSVSGIFNVGTGKSSSFNEVARQVMQWHGRGKLQYVEFPETLKHSYQSYTEADVGRLRKAGYQQQFLSLEQGVARYLDWLNGKRRA